MSKPVIAKENGKYEVKEYSGIGLYPDNTVFTNDKYIQDFNGYNAESYPLTNGVEVIWNRTWKENINPAIIVMKYKGREIFSSDVPSISILATIMNEYEGFSFVELQEKLRPFLEDEKSELEIEIDSLARKKTELLEFFKQKKTEIHSLKKQMEDYLMEME